MSFTFKVKATSTLPPARSVWEVDLGDDPKEVFLYTNLAYDLIAAAMSKLGIAMSEHILGDDAKEGKMLGSADEKLNALIDEAHGRVE